MDEKAVVYQMIRVIMDEPEEDNFHKQCQGFLKYLLEAGFNSFHDYFRLNYLSESRIHLWPKCFRKDITITTNNYLESMHKLLKYVYMNGKKVKRLDHTLSVLNKLVKDKLFKRMVDLMRNRSGCSRKLCEKHREGMKLEVSQEDHGVFQVSSGTYKDKLYQVRTHDITCETCRERCPICNVCKCMYSISAHARTMMEAGEFANIYMQL